MLHQCCRGPRAVIIIMTIIVITITGFSQSDLLWLYKYIKLHQELSPQHISGCSKFILPVSLWCYVLKDGAYMTWVQYSIAIVPTISIVYSLFVVACQCTLCTDRPPRTLVESDSTICCMYIVYPPEDEHLRLETCTGT